MFYGIDFNSAILGLFYAFGSGIGIVALWRLFKLLSWRFRP